MSEDAEPVPVVTTRSKFTRFLLTGLAVLLPVFLTGYIVFVLYRFVDTNLGRWIALPLSEALGEPKPSPATRVAGDILAVLLVLGLAISAGALAASYIGRKIIGGLQNLLLKLPFVRVIFPYVKQVTDFFLTEQKLRFRSVVAVPYPRRGIYSLGFITGGSMRSLNEAVGEKDMVHIFIPSSPTPVTGYVIFVPRREVIELPVSVDEALRFSISGGVLVPPREVVEAALATRGQEELPPPEGPAWGEDA